LPALLRDKYVEDNGQLAQGEELAFVQRRIGQVRRQLTQERCNRRVPYKGVLLTGGEAGQPLKDALHDSAFHV